jgi:hypothetical protein
MSPPALRALKRLGARYDLAALQPPDPAYASVALAAPRRPAWRALRRWCLAGLGKPALPGLPLTVAVLEPAPGPGQAETHALAQALCLERDGSLQLLACRSAAERLALRLKTKLHDITPGRALQPGDAWDAGLLPGTAEALQALARFEPRRPTLLVALGLPAPAMRAICALLHARQTHFQRPVRLLLVPAAQGLAWGRPVTRIAMDPPKQPSRAP